jgi:signal transduction histidine kinase
MRDLAASRPATVGYAVLFAMCVVFSVLVLAAGATVVVADAAPEAFTNAAAQGGSLSRGVLQAIPLSEPLGQAALDYAFSLLSLIIGAILLASRAPGWPIRLLALAMVASAGAFSLQAHAGAVAVQAATGVPADALYRVALQAVACAAYLLAVLLFPAGRLFRPASGPRRTVATAGVGALMLIGVATAPLPRTISCVLFFGLVVPLVGLAVLPRRRSQEGLTIEQRTQARLLFSVLAAVLPVVALLALITQLWWETGWSGLNVLDPTALGGAGVEQPTALLFWFTRFASVAVAAVVLVVTRQAGLWTAERVLGLWLAATLVVALIGGTFVIVEQIAGAIIAVLLGAGLLSGVLIVTVLATALEALLFVTVHVRAERLVDRLLYGARPTPYSVLAEITALSRSAPRNDPDLVRVAEAVARGVGATTCRLTVVRPGMRDRSYSWAAPGTDPEREDLYEVPAYHGEERIGSIAVDRGAVVGLYAGRRRLLTDIADSLGVVMAANRTGVELERQLRAVLAHAESIAVSRRRTIAAMDSERRRIERDLHDGTQHRLVSLRLALGLVAHEVETAQFDRARDHLEQIAHEIEVADSVLSATVAGVSSPLLLERGLVAALASEFSSGHPPIALEVDGLDAGRRFSADIEAAVYYCCLESVNNARKHAAGAAVSVRLAAMDDRLRFTVRDTGPGYDPRATSGSPGHGLRNVQARMRAVGGRIEIRSRPGAGTTIEGSVPVPAGHSAPAPHGPLG